MISRTTPLPSTTSIANWYGSNRMLAEHVGAELVGCSWFGVPFAGGMSEILHITARGILINDLHRHVINLAKVIADPASRSQLYQQCDRLAFHPDTLSDAQLRCHTRETRIRSGNDLFGTLNAAINASQGDIDWAADYLVCSWMGRGGQAGTAGEFDGSLSVRFNAGGGGSAVRYRSFLRSLVPWCRAFRGCEFTTFDASDFIDRCWGKGAKAGDGDADGKGIYCDPPFPGPGDLYKFPALEADHRRWAKQLSRFKHARVVLRYYDHPLVREIYPEGPWTYVRRAGRDRTNNDEKPELLIINGPSRAGAGGKGVCGG